MDAVGPIRLAAIVVCSLLGLFFTFVSMTGVLRLPDVYARAHTASQADTLGAGFALAAVALAAAGPHQTPPTGRKMASARRERARRRSPSSRRCRAPSVGATIT